MHRQMTYDLSSVLEQGQGRTDNGMKRNHIAKDLRQPKYRQRTLKNKRRYTRKVKHLQTQLEIQEKT
jgi:hypothetical protein